MARAELEHLAAATQSSPRGGSKWIGHTFALYVWHFSRQEVAPLGAKPYNVCCYVALRDKPPPCLFATVANDMA